MGGSGSDRRRRPHSRRVLGSSAARAANRLAAPHSASRSRPVCQRAADRRRRDSGPRLPAAALALLRSRPAPRRPSLTPSGSIADGEAPGWSRAMRTFNAPALMRKCSGACSCAASPSMPAATASGACTVNDLAVHSHHGRERPSRGHGRQSGYRRRRFRADPRPSWGGFPSPGSCPADSGCWIPPALRDPRAAGHPRRPSGAPGAFASGPATSGIVSSSVRSFASR